MKTVCVLAAIWMAVLVGVQAQSRHLGQDTPKTVIEPSSDYLALFEEARKLASEGKLDEAEQQVRVVLAKYPHHGPSNQLLTMISRQRAADPTAALRRKLDNIMIPRVNFKDAVLESAIDFLRDETRRLDPNKKGVSFVVNLPDDIKKRKLTLDLIDVPAADVLQYMSEIGGFKYRLERSAVVISSKEPFTATTTVPPADPGLPPIPGG